MKLETLSENKIILSGFLASQGGDWDLMEDITMCLNRFFAGDFGEIPEKDAQANRDNLENEAGRIIGRYNPGGDMEALLKPIYIMAYFSETEPGEDYNYTSVLYVSDYQIIKRKRRRRERCEKRET